MAETKFCPPCQTHHPLDAFGTRPMPTRKDPSHRILQSWCRAARNARGKPPEAPSDRQPPSGQLDLDGRPGTDAYVDGLSFSALHAATKEHGIVRFENAKRRPVKAIKADLKAKLRA